MASNKQTKFDKEGCNHILKGLVDKFLLDLFLRFNGKIFYKLYPSLTSSSEELEGISLLYGLRASLVDLLLPLWSAADDGEIFVA